VFWRVEIVFVATGNIYLVVPSSSSGSVRQLLFRMFIAVTQFDFKNLSALQ